MTDAGATTVSYCCGFLATLVAFTTLTVTDTLTHGDGGWPELSVDPWMEPVWFLEGDPFLMTCTVNGTMEGDPQWWKNAAPIDPDETGVTLTKMTDSSVPKIVLTMKKNEVTMDDMGRYNCWYEGQDIGIDIKVVTVTYRDANLTQGYPTSLTCDVEPYTPMCSISWLKGQVPVNKIPELDKRLVYGEHNTSITIHNSKMTDVGVYTCIIHFNKETEFEQSFSRSPGIRGKPHVKESEVESLKKVSNTSITLVCPVRAYPEPEVFWLRGEDIIEDSDHYVLTSYNGVPDSQLEMKNPTDQDYGDYACVMENCMGKAEYVIQVKNINGNSAAGTSVVRSNQISAATSLGLLSAVSYIFVHL